MFKSSKSILLGLALIVAFGTASECWAGSFIFSLMADGVTINNDDFIMHPSGYTGVGAALTVDLCIDDTSANALAMVTPVANIAARITALLGTTGNLTTSGLGDTVPAASHDFESVALHEVIHCLGLAHPNAASESGLAGAQTDYTKAGQGADTAFDLGAGTDTVEGSSDDIRHTAVVGDDDVNVHWFEKSVNNPCAAPVTSTFDNSTYSIAPADYPGGHTFAANGDRDVCTGLGVANTEAVMQQGTPNGEAQRALGHDDVATLKLAMSGNDEIQGNADDYTLTVNSMGQQTLPNVACEITLDFDNTQTTFAVCQTGFSFSGDHGAITSASIFFNTTAVTWFYNTTPVQLQSFTVE